MLKWRLYKLCLYIQSGRYDLLDKAINDVPFKEYFDYDIDKVGLYKELRNKIYDNAMEVIDYTFNIRL